LKESSGLHDRQNFIVNAVEGAAWVAGSSMISAQTVLPALVTRMGGGTVAIGALGVITTVGVYLPQIFASRYGQTLEWKKPFVVGYGVAQRVTILAMTVLIFLMAGTSPLVALTLFLILYSLNQIFIGLCSPVWFDFYAKLTPLRRRGRLTGVRNSLAGTMAFFCGFLLTGILTGFDFPVNYGLAFLIATGFQAVSIVLQWKLVEEYPSPVTPRMGVGDYLRHLSEELASNHEFRRFLVASVFLVMAAAPVSFYTVFALEHFKAGELMVGEYTLAMVGGQIIGALGNGWLSDRFGNKTALISASGALLFATALAIVAPNLSWFLLVFVLLGLYTGSELMTRYNLVVEYGPPEKRSLYVGLMNTVLAPFYCSSLAGGVLIARFGYTTLFLAGIVCSVIGIVLLIRFVRDPRTSLRLAR
jgi:MFS family permease